MISPKVLQSSMPSTKVGVASTMVPASIRARISAIEHSSEKTSPSSRYHMVNTIPGCAGLLPLCEASLALSRE